MKLNCFVCHIDLTTNHMEFTKPALLESEPILTVVQLNDSNFDSFKTMRRISLKESPEAFSAVTNYALTLQLAEDKKRIQEGEMIPLILQEGEQLASMATLYQKPQEDGSTAYELWYVYTMPDMRGKGYAGAILDTAIDMAQQLGWPHLDLTVFQTQTRAREIYETLGFQHMGEEEVEKADGSWHWRDIMRLTFDR